MPIDDSILRGRPPKLGTVTVGRGVEATAQSGSTYSRPRRTETLCFHTNDPEIANAVQVALGGDVHTDSPTWGFDVVVDETEVEVSILPGGFRQALESWRAAECVRRCDGVTMETLNGRPTSRPCMCADEMDSGRERLCSPTTILPCFVDLDVDRFGVWEVRSGAWGSAAQIKGAIQMLTQVGAGSEVPAVLSVHKRKVRTASDDVHEVPEIHVTVAATTAEMRSIDPSDVPAGELPAAEDRAWVVLMETWEDLQARAERLDIVEGLRSQFRSTYGERVLDDLSVDELRDWIGEARDLIAEVEDVDPSEGDESDGEPSEARGDPDLPADPETADAAT